MEKIKKFINYFIKEWALFIILAIGLPLIITNFVTRTTVSGTSMLPTYVDGEKGNMQTTCKVCYILHYGA